MEGLVAFWVVFVILLLVLSVCWILLPFFILGTNKRLDRLIAELKTLNARTAMSGGSRAASMPSGGPSDLHVSKKAPDGRYVIGG